MINLDKMRLEATIKLQEEKIGTLQVANDQLVRLTADLSIRLNKYTVNLMVKDKDILMLMSEFKDVSPGLWHVEVARNRKYIVRSLTPQAIEEGDNGVLAITDEIYDNVQDLANAELMSSGPRLLLIIAALTASKVKMLAALEDCILALDWMNDDRKHMEAPAYNRAKGVISEEKKNMY